MDVAIFFLNSYISFQLKYCTIKDASFITSLRIIAKFLFNFTIVNINDRLIASSEHSVSNRLANSESA